MKDFDINRFSIVSQNVGVCAWFSYWRLLDYFKPSNISFSFHNFGRHYIKYMEEKHGTLSCPELEKSILDGVSNGSIPNECLSVWNSIKSSLTKDNLDNLCPLIIESLVYGVFHCYCHKNNKDGLDHINDLHQEWSKTNFLPIQLPPHTTEFIDNHTIIKNTIDDLVLSKTDDIIIPLSIVKSGGYHAVLLINDAQRKTHICDPNISCCLELKTYQNQVPDVPLYTAKFDVNGPFKECIRIKLN